MTERDDSGRDRLFRNAVAGWWAHGVTVVIGFVLPRVIYESVGQVALGVWDIGWSLVTYIAYSGLGTSSAVTHYVARHRAEGSASGVRDTTAAAWYCQGLLALLAGVAFLALFASLHLWLPSLENFDPQELLSIGVFLGLAIVVGLLGSVAQGVLAGCHRGSWNEYVTIASDVALAFAMIGVLVAGWGVVGLAGATFVTRLIFEVGRFALADWVCPDFSLRIQDASWRRAGSIFRFGTKTSAWILQDLLIQQVARLVLAASAGPVAVACYSRYATLIRQIGRSVERVTQALPAMTSGLVGLGRQEDVQHLSLRASNAAVMMMLPMIVVFGVLGDDLVTLWMGPEFVIPGLAWVLAAMAALHSDRGVTTQVLSGLDSHGKVALACLFASIAIMLALLLVLYPLDPLTTGIVLAISTVVGVTVPHFVLSCRRLGLSYLQHLRYVYVKPLISNLLFLLLLLWARERMHEGEIPLAAAYAGSSVLLLAALYWYFVFDERLRMAVRKRLPLALSRTS